MTAQVDANWASDEQSRKSVSGGLIKLGSTVIHNWSRKQETVALSSGEAEYYSMCTGTCEGLHIQGLLSELQRTTGLALETDSTAAKGNAERNNSKGRMKHIDIKHHFIRDLVQSKKMQIRKVPGGEWS